MALKITKATDPITVSTITMCLYAVPGVGKTSMGCTAEKPLLLDFDRGAYRSKNRGDVVQVESWPDVLDIKADDLKPYKTVVVDTAGRALDVLGPHIIKNNPKAGNRLGGLSLQGFGEMKTAFTSWIKLVRSFGLDVVLLSHSDEQKDGDDIRERLDIQGGSKNEIYKAADCMGRIYMRNGQRMLNFSPTDTAFGKNPAGFDPLPVPDYATEPRFLAGVIERTKAALNQLSAEQTSTAASLDEWRLAIEDAETVEDFNGILPAVHGSDERVRDNVKRLLVKAAKMRGFAFDKKAGAFVDGQAAA